MIDDQYLKPEMFQFWDARVGWSSSDACWSHTIDSVPCGYHDGGNHPAQFCLLNRSNYFETFSLLQVTGGLEYVLPIMAAVMLAKWVGDVVGELQCVCVSLSLL